MLSARRAATFTLDETLADQARRLGVNTPPWPATAARVPCGPPWRELIVTPTRSRPRRSTTSGPTPRLGGTSEPREIWLAEVGRKRRPVLVLTRDEVIDVRSLITVAEISTSSRGLAAEVEIDNVLVGLERESVINCDGVHTVAQGMLTTRVGEVDEDTLERVCSAVSYAIGC